MKRYLLFAFFFAYPFCAQADRTPIDLPPMIHDQFLANMRDHLLAVSEIQTALGAGQFKKAADIASSRLGLKAPSSAACRMKKANSTMADPLAKYMPPAMHKIGFQMHTAADHFADVANSKDYKEAIGALALVTKQCASCHANFKLADR